MSHNDFTLWVYLSRTPLLWLTMTVCVYIIVDALAQKCNRHPLVNPLLLSVLVIGAILLLTGTDYQAYFEGAQFIHFMIGPATVALAVPLYQHRHIVRRSLVPMMVSLLCGSLTACVSAVVIASVLGVPRTVLLSIAPKSVTAGVAMSISEGLGGDPALTAVLVMSTGVLGAIMVTPLMNSLGIRDFRARGFAVGLASHGLGTARAFQVHPVAGTFAGIAIGLNALLTAVIVPWVVTIFIK
jgi:predicted murein hydrolase (TIGR00659 family)